MNFISTRKYFRSKTVNIILAVLVLLFLFDLLFPPPTVKQYSKEIIADEGTLISAYLTNDDKWRLRTDIDDVSPELIKAIIEKEDSWFFWHFGVNPVSIIRAVYSNALSGKRISGASTITMQVIRLLEPRERTHFNKLIEMFRAVQFELHHSKREILEIYLSLLPFGGNIEGVESASYIYFNRPPKQLSLAQSILLCAIPNNPNSRRLDRYNDDIFKVRNHWINYFKNENTFPQTDLDDASDEPIETHRYAIPSLAPHFAYFVKDNYDGDRIKTTLNLRIQQTAEELLLNHINRVFLKGITNGAVLIIDNKTSSVVGYCGSADFNDVSHSGQVNGITAIRSPGSTLKAALFAHAFDEGILTPQMKIEDIPTDFNGYEPENYDLKFYGNISASFALENSLNIPAVKLLRKVRLENFINLLEECGFNEISNRKKKLGLSLILGGCGVTLAELTRLFTAFARDGELHQLAYTIDQFDEDENIKVFSPASSYLTSNILSGRDRNDIVDLSIYSKLPKFAWKTGTSYGKRDAWAIGFNQNYTIGVWMGNFDGGGSPHLSGAEAAVPLLFDLFNAIDYGSESDWFNKPREVFEREVCAESGLLPTQYCDRTITDYAINNSSHNIICNIHQPVYVNLEETIQYCTGCIPSKDYERKIYPLYDPELTVWLSENNYNFIKPPPHNPDCQAKFTQNGPRILSPSEDYDYFIEEDSEQEILLLAASDSKAKTHYWYVNDKFYTKCTPGEKIFLKPENGENKISCLDDKGRDESVSIKVKYF
jgi:penicillin-binding protein 1C